MNDAILNVTSIITIVLGGFYTSISLFRWGVSSYLRVEPEYVGATYKASAPIIIITMVGVGFLSLTEHHIFNIYSNLVFFLLNSLFVIISWYIFFKAIFNFRRLKRIELLLIMLGMTIVIKMYYETSGLPQDKGIYYGSVTQERAVLNSWLQARDKEVHQLIKYYEWARKVLYQGGVGMNVTKDDNKYFISKDELIDLVKMTNIFIETMDKTILAQRYQYNDALYLDLLTIYFFWLIPLSLVIGKLYGRIKLEFSPLVSGDNIDGLKYLLGENDDYLIIINSRLREEQYFFIKKDNLNKYFIVPNKQPLIDYLDNIRKAFIAL